MWTISKDGAVSVIVIERPGMIEAWQEATRYLLQHGDTTNIIVEISDPLSPDAVALSRHSPKRLLTGAKSANDIADTICRGDLLLAALTVTTSTAAIQK